VRRRLHTLDLTRGIPSVDLGQAQIHEDQVGPLLHSQRDGLSTVGGPHDLVAGHCQPAAEHVRDEVVVFDDQDLGHAG
jgi:hypothetical protein